MMTNLQRTGRAAAASGMFMLAGVEGEWVLDPQADDGSVTNLPVFTLLVTTATIGFVLLLLAVHGLRAHAAPTRTARAGALMSLLGSALMLGFGLTILATSLLTGSPLELAFVAFGLGMLLLSAGPITWALSLRRHSPPRGSWQMLFLAGAAALAALAIEADPWHDVSLVTMFTAWTALGLLLLRKARTTASTLHDHNRVTV